MEKLNGGERVIATLKQESRDRVAIHVIPGQYPAQLVGLSIEECYTDARKGAQARIAFYEHFPVDLYSLSGATSSCVAEACGNELESPEAPPKKRILADKSNLSGLNLPDPQRDKRLPFVLELCERVSSHIKDSLARASICWPWTLAGQLRGLQELIYDTADDPGFVHDLMRYCTDCVMLVASAVDEVLANEGGLNFTEPSAGCSVISPKIYREFVKPYHQEIMNYWQGKGRILGLHICGDIDPIIEDLVTLGFDIIDIDTPASLARALAVAQGKAVICGNVSPVLFAQGNKEDIEQAVRTCLEVGKPYAGYILSPGCALPRDSIYENVKHFLEAGIKLGNIT